jgi:hypothetical protein
LLLAAEMPLLRGILITTLVIVATFYSLQILPNDLRLMLGRVMPVLSSRLSAMLK